MWWVNNSLARLMNSSPNSERSRLARELHDGLAQELASLGYRLDQVIGSSNLDNKDRAPLRQIRFTLSGLISQVRNEIFELRSNQSKPISEQVADQVSIILANTSINYEITGELAIKPEQQFDLLRSIREITINALRHAQCQNIRVQLNQNIVVITDDGIGGAAEKDNSYGLTGVKERLFKIGAQMELISQSSGTSIVITF